MHDGLQFISWWCSKYDRLRHWPRREWRLPSTVHCSPWRLKRRLCTGSVVGGSDQSKEAKSSQLHRNTASKAMPKLGGGASLLAQIVNPFPYFAARHSYLHFGQIGVQVPPESNRLKVAKQTRHRTHLLSNMVIMWKSIRKGAFARGQTALRKKKDLQRYT